MRFNFSANKLTATESRPPKGDIDGLVQERRNSIANALELRLSYTNPTI